MDIAWVIFFACFTLIPIAAAVGFVVSLVLYLKRRRENRLTLANKASLAIFSVLLGCVTVSVILLVAVFAMAIAFM